MRYRQGGEEGRTSGDEQFEMKRKAWQKKYDKKHEQGDYAPQGETDPYKLEKLREEAQRRAEKEAKKRQKEEQKRAEEAKKKERKEAERAGEKRRKSGKKAWREVDDPVASGSGGRRSGSSNNSDRRRLLGDY